MNRPPRRTALVCPAQTVGGTVFAASNAGTTGTGSCAPGYQQGASAPSLQCNSAGNWTGSISNPCTRMPVVCTDKKRPPSWLTGRARHRAGPWVLAEITCPAISDDASTSWPSAVAGNPPTVTLGACKTGYYVVAGVPYRGCDISGNWQTVQNPCQSTSHKAPCSGWVASGHPAQLHVRCASCLCDCRHHLPGDHRGR